MIFNCPRLKTRTFLQEVVHVLLRRVQKAQGRTSDLLHIFLSVTVFAHIHWFIGDFFIAVWPVYRIIVPTEATEAAARSSAAAARRGCCKSRTHIAAPWFGHLGKKRATGGSEWLSPVSHVFTHIHAKPMCFCGGQSQLLPAPPLKRSSRGTRQLREAAMEELDGPRLLWNHGIMTRPPSDLASIAFIIHIYSFAKFRHKEKEQIRLLPGSGNSILACALWLGVQTLQYDNITVTVLLTTKYMACTTDLYLSIAPISHNIMARAICFAWWYSML